ncbi:hypothetical protein BUALT_Bualt04G0112900 [Buddleja alternifolia]|uniref:BAT2 N-terminal domain-containing protein n=1 Tax=Buddleja alternifolia TaxID=168488 RepID=A0AAV6XQ67_9LAMI|nr:hypothetical protein BUALT_Bualt04G0112900 [Buddleja alternifolia]
MANHGSKFVSVNLNKSYGHQHHPNHHSHYSSFNGGGGGSYGQAAAAGRGRGGIGGGGGMVVLSRNRGAAPKAASKLSVPPPLNLPSLRKEHEKFDTLGPGGGPGGGAGTGSGSRPTSSGVGWTKPVAATTVIPHKNESIVDTPGVDGFGSADGASRGSGSYMPPSARSNGVGVVGSGSVSRNFPPSVEKAMVLRGEDFPSLQAARPVSSGGSQKQKDSLNQKQKQVAREELAQDKRDSYHLGPLVDMGASSRNTVGNQLVENGGERRGIGTGRMADQIQKQEKYFPDPLPLVHMNPRSNWEDDERDTGHGFVERRRDSGYSNSESYWDRDFDLPRPSLLPHKPVQNQYDRRGQRDNETGKKFSSEVLKMDPYHKDVRAPSREGQEVNKFRTSAFSKDGFNSQEVGNYRNDVGARMTGPNNMINENRYSPPQYGNTNRDGSVMLNRDSTFGRRDLGLIGRQQQRNNSMESFNNRGSERSSWDRHVAEHPNRYRGDNSQSNTLSKSSFASSGRMHPINDPILTMGRDKRSSKSDRSFSEDPFLRDFGSSGFDEQDLFSGGLVGVIKRKKDAVKSTDFHDPVRESFEAELERVQKMQELERQRIVEEQERALEHARREEEERQRKIRDEEESRRRLEEEAREDAWRAEQERVEAIRKAEELRIAREEEKRRIYMEEERRKQAAMQKLQELEAKMAKRGAETFMGGASVSNTIVDDKLEAAVKEKDTSMSLDLDTWEDGERMVENVTASASFESSAHSRPLEMGSRPYPPREGSSNILDRGKAINSWRRDVFDGDSFPPPLSDPDTGHYSPRQDAFGGGRAAPHTEFNGGAGYMSSRGYLKAGVQEPHSDEFGYQKHHRWGLSGDADSYGKLREMDSEYHDSASDKYGDSGWGLGRARGNTRHPYPERLYPHSEANELYSYGRSRYSMRQPRVLPPPIASAQRTNFRRVTEHSGPSTFLDNDIQYAHATRSESSRQTAYYGSNQGGLEPSEVVGLQQENSTLEDQNKTIRCDSQSSLSVSSPPNSPPHLSHDELDESGDSPVTSAVADGKRSVLTVNELNVNSGNSTIVMPSDSISAVEDEEWTENDDTLQQQEEYDEDEDGYREEDEVREVDDENLEMNEKFEGLELEERESSHMMENVVLGFDEGVEVVIPSDDLVEKKLVSHEKSFGISNSSDGLMEERGPVDGFPSNEQRLRPADNSYSKNAASSIVKVPEGSIDQPVGTPSSSETVDLLDNADSSGSTGVAAQHTGSSSGDISATADQTNMSSFSSAGSPADLPVKLQFGLFSGPSLIPSPVPAIQIGSIQMPLHIHPPIGPSLPHLHPSQPPMFQFGQIRYTSPISQGILPMATQSMSFVQPNMHGHLNLKQNAGGSVPSQPARDASIQDVSTDVDPSISLNKQPSFVSVPAEQSNVSLSQGLNPVLDGREDNSIDRSSSSGVSGANDKKIKQGYGSHGVKKGQYDAVSKARGSESQLQNVQPAMQSLSGERNFSAQRGLGPAYGGRGKRFAYAVKNANQRSSFQYHDMAAESNGFQRRPRRTVQRTEFRVRENNDRRAGPVFVSPNDTASDDKSNYTGKAVGVFTRSGSKRGAISNRTMKQRIESEPSTSGNMISHGVNSGDSVAKEMSKNLSIKSQHTSHSGEANLRRNVSEDDVDAPLQSGVVRVFKQPGIEAPSDEDDFIEVRSKRQMLNDRREQRAKEMKAKSHANIKPPRKPRSTRQMDVVSRSHNKLYMPLDSEESKNSHLDFAASDRPQFVNNEGSTGFTTAVSQHTVGAPAINSEVQSVKAPQAGCVSVVSRGGAERDQDIIFDRNDKVMDLVESSSTTWNTAGINQQTQTQINEVIEPARYDSHISAVGGHTSAVSDPILPTSAILTKDKTFSSGASPINSLLAGEKIQFGAVTSPTVLPPSSRVVSLGIGAPGSNRPDLQMSRNFPVSENENSLFFEKEKHLSDSCVPLQDSEAEAEAAASAVAVAAISSDEIVGNGLGSVNSKSFGSADIDGITSGVVGDQHLARQSRGEELSVSLPADLSVETTPISLWPLLPSPQSSRQMVSHFPGGPPSHFPFYEMNPLLGGQIFAFSPHEESSGTQSQPQKSTAASGPLGNWQQCHSGVDSFYGHPAGYPGPFISPPGGIPGVQGPPHMVVYNHFAPVEQYGQVGLSFMGTTYIPSGKQADWKNNPTSSAMHIGEGDVNNMNMNTVQRNAPIQHLAPGSPLLPMPSPLPMFDVSPFQYNKLMTFLFQTAPDLPVQARWGHIPASQLHSVPVSRPLQSQVEVALPSQVNHGHTIDQSLAVNRFTESRIPTPSDNNSPRFTVASDTNIAPFSAELGLVDPLRSTTTSSGQSSVVKSSSGSANAEPCKNDKVESGIGNISKHQSASSVKTHFSQKSSGYTYPRGGMSQRNNTGNDWSHRRMGFHGRNQSTTSMDKSYPSSKMKQIYVPKQTTSGSSTT